MGEGRNAFKMPSVNTLEWKMWQSVRWEDDIRKNPRNRSHCEKLD